jgi:hypothetical protein
MNGVNQKNFGLIFTTRPVMQVVQPLIKKGRSDKNVIR